MIVGYECEKKSYFGTGKDLAEGGVVRQIPNYVKRD